MLEDASILLLVLGRKRLIQGTRLHGVTEWGKINTVESCGMQLYFSQVWA